MLRRRRVVITGVGVIAPNGIGKDAFWASLLAGQSGIGTITLFDPAGLPCRIAGEVKGFDPSRYIPPKLKPERRMARSSQFAIASASMAISDAGLSPESLRRKSGVPVVMGTAALAMDVLEKPAQPWTVSAVVPSAPASAISVALQLDARVVTLSAACTSGLSAVNFAAREIVEGRADVVLAGAAESMITRYTFESFSRAGMLSQRNDEPGKSSRPFDRDRDGGVMSEGAAVLVLEADDHACARGASPYAEIAGYAACGDSIAGGSGDGLERSMVLAISNALMRPEQIGHVSAHAPSDPIVDLAETRLIRKVLGSHAYRIPVTSIKGVTGNPIGVASAFQCVVAALSIRHGMVAPTANLVNPGEGCDLDYVQGAPRILAVDNILVNSHGLGGFNGSMVIAKPRSG